MNDSGRVREFARGKRLNFYKRARLGNQVKTMQGPQLIETRKSSVARCQAPAQ